MKNIIIAFLFSPLCFLLDLLPKSKSPNIWPMYLAIKTSAVMGPMATTLYGTLVVLYCGVSAWHVTPVAIACGVLSYIYFQKNK